MSKKPKNRKSKYSNTKSSKRMLNGLIIKWSIEDPLLKDDEILNAVVTHKNPTARTKLKQMQPTLNSLLNRLFLKWRIDIDIEFVDDFNKTYIRPTTIVIQCVLHQANEYFDKAIEDIFDKANMNHYKMTHITAEIKSCSGINEKDFN